MKKNYQIKAVLAGLMLSSSVVPVASADDTEIYTTLSGPLSTSNPNIMFVVDTSGSMSTESWVNPSYNEKTDYKGDCLPDAIYYTGKSCAEATTADYFMKSALNCDHAVVGYNFDGTKITPGQDGSLTMIGTYSDQLAQFDPVTKKWRELKTGTTGDDNEYMVECFSDSGIHGSGSGGSDYIADGGTGYTSTVPADPKSPHPVWDGGAGNLQLFDGNYKNYSNTVFPAGELVLKSYLEQVKSAVEIMVRGNTRIDIGLMRFDSKDAANGGAIQYPILDVGADRADFFARLKTMTPGGYTPLSEVYYESLLYFGGKKADFSKLSNPGNQVVADTMKSGNVEFRSPISSVCDKNYIVLLTDGKPTKDDLDASQQSVLTGFTGSCSSDITDDWDDDNRDAKNSGSSSIDNCLDELADWAYTKDVAEEAIDAHEGEQHITTYTIGLNLDPVKAAAEAKAANATDAQVIAIVDEIEGAIQLLKDAGKKGNGGKNGYYPADSEAKLIKIFNKIINATLQVNTTFSSPAVSVNAFNRSTHLNDLYFTLFKPGDGNHWDGNLKKYKLEFETDVNTGDVIPFIADQNHDKAIDPNTGFFSDTAQSYWSPSVDGKEVSDGGVVSQFKVTPLSEKRKVYTFTGSYNDNNGVKQPSSNVIISSTNEVKPGNTSLTDALLGITGFSEIVTGTSYRETLINWASGLDALSEYGDGNTFDDVRPQMGDPLHAEPALVQYGGDVNNPDLVAYVATNDGYLHAFDSVTGEEYFSYIPQELLANLSTAMEGVGGSKLYGLDGSVVAWVYDKNKDGIITTGTDHVYLYLTMRRGGRDIYALDVTDRKAPKFLWKIEGGSGAYSELGDTWSTVNVEKIKVNGTETAVLIFGGGYDDAQDSSLLRTTDSVGNAVFIANAETGERLWSASAGVGADLTIAEMEYSIPARVKPLDISGDGYIDRLYVADVGGQLFRFDINNKISGSLGSTITGGRIAELAGSVATDARRFYYPPDVALIDAPDGNYHALIISSGFRAHPLYDVIHDRIFMIKDRDTGMTTSYTTLLEVDLKDVSDNLAGGDSGVIGDTTADAAREAELALIQGAEGWYIDLEDEDNPGTWLGEKGLAEPLILQGTAIVTTYTPNLTPSTDGCTPNVGTGKVYFLDMLDATPAFPSNVDVRQERHTQLVRGGIPPTPNVIITKGGEPTLCIGTECEPANLGLGLRKTYWYEVEK